MGHGDAGGGDGDGDGDGDFGDGDFGNFGDGDFGDGDGLPKDAPIVAVMHTLTGTADDFAELARVSAARGFRVAVCLRRGHLGVPLKTPRFNLLGHVDDLDIHIGAIKRAYPTAAALFGYGESAGTGLAVRYSGEKRDDCPFAAVVCVCPGYDTTEGGRAVHRPITFVYFARRLISFAHFARRPITFVHFARLEAFQLRYTRWCILCRTVGHWLCGERGLKI